MKRLLIVLGIALVAVGAAFAETPQHTIRGGLLYVSPTGSEDVDFFDYAVADDVELDSGWGLTFAYEYRFTDMIGLEGSLSWSKHDFKAKDHATGEEVESDEDTAMMPLAVALNIHPLKDSKVDLYFGPVVAWVMYDDIEIDDVESDFNAAQGSYLKIEADNDIAWGVQIGMDVPINDRGLAFNAALKYFMTKYKADMTYHHGEMEEPFLAADGDATDEMEIDVNPWIVQVGLAYRF